MASMSSAQIVSASAAKSNPLPQVVEVIGALTACYLYNTVFYPDVELLKLMKIAF
jgi:hypothetical protein